MNGAEVSALVLLVANLWPGWRPPGSADGLSALVEAWTEVLERTPAECAMAAAKQAAKDGAEWPPPVGRLNRLALGLAGVEFPPDPAEAWLEVEDAMQYVGRYGTPSWSHPAIREAMRAMGGFRSLCASEDGMADRAHFTKTIYPPIALAHEREAIDPTPALLSLPAVIDAELEPPTTEPVYRFTQREADLIGKDVP